MRDFDEVVLFCHYIMSKTGYHNNWKIYYLKYGPPFYFGPYIYHILSQYGGVEYGIRQIHAYNKCLKTVGEEVLVRHHYLGHRSCENKTS